jgi:hypothetical protein
MAQMARLGIWQQGPLPLDFERLFQNLWADNADAVSRQYSGTGRLGAARTTFRPPPLHLS